MIIATTIWLTTRSGATSLWTIGGMFFALGAGLGLIMQNAVPADQAAAEPLETAIIDALREQPRAGPPGPRAHLAVAFLLALALTEIPLSESAGMIARGEAVDSEEE